MSAKAPAGLLLIGALASPLAAREMAGQTPADTVVDTHEIVVTAPAPQGAVIGNVPPDIELGEEEIASYGAASLAELVEALAPATGSGRGRGEGGPVVLLDGRRVSGFGEIRTIPPEAILKVQVLPEEAAIAYGYRPEQRVINIMLRPGFRSVTAEARVRAATEGGRGEHKAGASLFRNGAVGRLSIDLEYEHDTPLYERERDIAATASTPDQRPYRTLLGAADRLSLNASLNRTIFEAVSATLNAKLDAADNRSALGLPVDADGAPIPGFDPLRGTSRSHMAHVGLALNGAIARWQWSLTANYDHARTRSRTDRGVEADATLLRDRARSVSDTGAAELVFTGPLLDLPAGPVRATLKASGDITRLDSRAAGVWGVRDTELSRQQGGGQASLVLPLTSRRDQVLPAIGDLSANLNAELRRLSDFGTIGILGYGLSWEPDDRLRLALSVAREEGASSLTQLGNPQITTPNVRLFDYLTGQTVDVTRIDGGNPALRADRRDSLSLSAAFKPLKGRDLTLDLGFTHGRTRDPVVSFPTPTQAIEAAFPERFLRNGEERLVAVDVRPVNLARQTQDELRWGLFLSLPVGTARPGAAPSGPLGALGALMPRGPGQAMASSSAGGGMRMGGGGGRFGPGAGAPGQGRLIVSFEHKWRLRDRALIREGLPAIDLLEGGTLSGSGGQPAHQLSARLNLFKDGIGGGFSGTWQSATRVLGGAGAGPESRLFFPDLAEIDFRLFVDFGRREALVRAQPWLKGVRLSLSVDNILNARQRVRNGLGDTPLGYQPAYLDPLGRSVRLSLRKLF